MDTPLISVLLNVYNGEAFLAETMKSVLNQTYENFEFIIVDDASTDRTAEIIRSFDDKRIRYIYNPVRRHIPYAGNLALKNATGEWIARIDADDVWVEDKLEKQIDYVLAHPEVGACFSYADLIDENSVHTEARVDLYDCFHTSFDSRSEWIRNFFFNDNCICNASSIVRKDLMEPYNLFCRQLHDFELWCNLIIKTDFYVYPEELVKYRCHLSGEQSSSLTQENIVRHINETMLVCRKGLLERLSDAELVDCFQHDFRCADSKSSLELKIERVFLLCKCNLTEGNTTAIALSAFEELLKQEGALSLLESKYDFSLFDLYDLTAENVLYTRPIQQKISALTTENGALRTNLADVTGSLAVTESKLITAKEKLDEYYEQLNRYKLHYETAIAQRDSANATIADYQRAITAIQDSVSWKVSAPIRLVGRTLRRLIH